jgi:hypothetical protein
VAIRYASPPGAYCAVWDSQRLPDIPGLLDGDSVEEWLSLLLNATKSHISPDHIEYVIFVGSAL